MAGLSEYDKANLARQLQAEFDKTEAPEEPQTVQRFSETTRTLYSDEETARRMIRSEKPVFSEPKKKELSTEEMLKLLERDILQKEPAAPKPRGYAKIETTEGKWHS